MIEEMGPGDELQLTIRRDNEELAIAVQLGSFGDAPMAFLRQLQPDFVNPFPSGLQGAPASLQLIDRALDDMRRQIRALRDEIRELKGNAGAKPAKPGDAKQGDVSALPNVGGAKLVSQIQLQIPQRNYQRNDFNSRCNPYGNYYNYSPYGRGYSPYSNNFGAPYGGNSYYYRYGGRPYYYGGNSNWYGNRPRAGIQIGPNVGVYWY